MAVLHFFLVNSSLYIIFSMVLPYLLLFPYSTLLVYPNIVNYAFSHYTLPEYHNLFLNHSPCIHTYIHLYYAQIHLNQFYPYTIHSNCTFLFIIHQGGEFPPNPIISSIHVPISFPIPLQIIYTHCSNSTFLLSLGRLGSNCLFLLPQVLIFILKTLQPA